MEREGASDVDAGQDIDTSAQGGVEDHHIASLWRGSSTHSISLSLSRRARRILLIPSSIRRCLCPDNALPSLLLFRKLAPWFYPREISQGSRGQYTKLGSLLSPSIHHPMWSKYASRPFISYITSYGAFTLSIGRLPRRWFKNCAISLSDKSVYSS